MEDRQSGNGIMGYDFGCYNNGTMLGFKCYCTKKTKFYL